MKKFVILLLVISIFSLSSLFVFADTDVAYIRLFSPSRDEKGVYTIENFSSVQSLDVEFTFVYDPSISFNQSQYVNQINVTIWRDIDGTLIPEDVSLRPSNYVYDSIYGLDPCFTLSDSLSPFVEPSYNYYLSYFGFEDDLFNSVPAYQFRDVLTAFVETQDDPGVNYAREYSYSDFAESGFVYYSNKFFPSDFSIYLNEKSLNFYQSFTFAKSHYYLFDEDGHSLSGAISIPPGFNSISFTNNDLYNINYVRNTDIVYVRQTNFSLVNDFNDPYVGVSFYKGASTYTPFSDFVYDRFYPYYKLPDNLYKYFGDFFGFNSGVTSDFSGDLLPLYLYTESSSATPEEPPLTPEEQDKLEQDLKEKEDLQRAIRETGWLNNTVESTFRKEVLYNNAVNGLDQLNKPNFNINDFIIDESSRSDLYNFAGLYAPVFNLDIVSSMITFGFILAFVSYVLFGKKG